MLVLDNNDNTRNNHLKIYMDSSHQIEIWNSFGHTVGIIETEKKQSYEHQKCVLTFRKALQYNINLA